MKNYSIQRMRDREIIERQRKLLTINLHVCDSFDVHKRNFSKFYRQKIISLLVILNWTFVLPCFSLYLLLPPSDFHQTYYRISYNNKKKPEDILTVKNFCVRNKMKMIQSNRRMCLCAYLLVEFHILVNSLAVTSKWPKNVE